MVTREVPCIKISDRSGCCHQSDTSWSFIRKKVTYLDLYFYVDFSRQLLLFLFSCFAETFLHMKTYIKHIFSFQDSYLICISNLEGSHDGFLAKNGSIPYFGIHYTCFIDCEGSQKNIVLEKWTRVTVVNFEKKKRVNTTQRADRSFAGRNFPDFPNSRGWDVW